VVVIDFLSYGAISVMSDISLHLSIAWFAFYFTATVPFEPINDSSSNTDSIDSLTLNSFKGTSIYPANPYPKVCCVSIRGSSIMMAFPFLST
jgi:hypothetical protein